MGELRVMSTLGDTKVIWDPENEDEVEAAEDQFDSLLGKGFKAFKVKKDGKAGVQIKRFNPNEAMYILVPELKGG
jgi:hypothetical protein